MGRVAALWLAAAAWAWGGACSTDEGPLEDRDDGVAPFCDLGAPACRADDDCGGGNTCSESCCLPACASDGECDPAACGPLGCVCDDGACRARVCSASAECDGGRICVAGACVEPAAADAAVSCVVAPRFAAIREGMERALAVTARDAAGAVIHPSEPPSFTSSAPERVAVDEAGVARGGASPGRVVITAAIGGARCEAELWNHAAPAAGALRVVAIDEVSGLPLEGALVQLETGATPLTATTGPDGAAIFAAGAVPAAPRTISVFHDDYAWITVAATGASDLLLPLRRLVPDDRAGGFRGVFGPEELFHPDFVHAGIAGTSIPGNLIDLSVPLLVGPGRRTRVTIGATHDVDIPSGVILGLGNTWFKQEYQALGMAGGCDDPARAATCGLRSAWGIAGGVPLLDLPIDELVEGGGDLEAGELLSRLLPHFQRFRSAVVRDLRFDLHPLRGGVPDWDRFARLDLVATQRLSLRSTVLLPELPRVGGAWMDGAVVFGGVEVPDRGVVPLGITAGIDADTAAGGIPDGRVDHPSGASNGEVPLRIAPAHGGLEGSDYVILALAADLSRGGCTATDRRGCSALSGLVERAASIPFGTVIDFGGAPFVAPAEEASWTPSTRTFVRGARPAGDPGVLRLQLTGGGGRRWHVWMAADTATFQLPVPAGIADRGADASASVQALRLDVDLDGLVAFAGARPGDPGAVLRAFSTIDLPRAE